MSNRENIAEIRNKLQATKTVLELLLNDRQISKKVVQIALQTLNEGIEILNDIRV